MNHDFPNAVAALTLTASPQEGDPTLQIKNRNNGRLGFVRQGLTLRDFTGTVLMLSEVQLLLEITAEQKTLLPATIKQERLVAHILFRLFAKPCRCSAILKFTISVRGVMN